MYAVKGRGGAAYAHYSREMQTGVAELVELGEQLRSGIPGGQLRLLYQPIVDLDTEELIGVEALVRWQHPDRGLLTPDKFLGLVVPLGSWVLREACAQAARWTAQYGPAAPGRISVNVAPVQLREPGFAAEVVEALASGLSRVTTGRDVDGDAVVVAALVFSSRASSSAVNRSYFNAKVWKPALKAVKVPTTRENGMHALRHWFASVQLEAGTSIKALAEYLGHVDAGFTLRVYT